MIHPCILLWAQWFPHLQLCYVPFLSQLRLLAGSLVVPEVQLHFGFRSLGEMENWFGCFEMNGNPIHVMEGRTYRITKINRII